MPISEDLNPLKQSILDQIAWAKEELTDLETDVREAETVEELRTLGKIVEDTNEVLDHLLQLEGLNDEDDPDWGSAND